MPGVPYEMMHNMSTQIIPRLAQHFNTPNIIHQTLITYGIPDSQLAIRIAEWEDKLPKNIHLAYLPNNGLVKLRLSGVADNREELKKIIQQLFEQLTPILGNAIIAHEDITPQEYLGLLLNKTKQTIATAESCTGGNIAHLITSVPGSSAYYKGSVIAYANEIKINQLDVNENDIIQHGAVSQQVVEQMAIGVRKKMNTHYGIATSGIAGPDGATTDKPVGTTWIAVATPEKVISRKFQFGNLREQNINRATQAALIMLIQTIKQQ